MKFSVLSILTFADLHHNAWAKLRSINSTRNLGAVLTLWSPLMENHWKKWWVSESIFAYGFIFLLTLAIYKLFIWEFFFLGRKSEICWYILKKSSSVSILFWIPFRQWASWYNGWRCYFKPFSACKVTFDSLGLHSSCNSFSSCSVWCILLSVLN